MCAAGALCCSTGSALTLSRLVHMGTASCDQFLARTTRRCWPRSAMDPRGFEPRATALQRRDSATELWARTASRLRRDSLVCFHGIPVIPPGPGVSGVFYRDSVRWRCGSPHRAVARTVNRAPISFLVPGDCVRGMNRVVNKRRCNRCPSVNVAVKRMGRTEVGKNLIAGASHRLLLSRRPSRWACWQASQSGSGRPY